MRPNILLIMVDSLRADRCWGDERQCRTPVLDDLRRQATVFTNAFSTASMTTICTAGILTGTYPFVHGIRSLAGGRLRPDLPTLAEAFQASGYHTWAEMTGPLEAMTGLDRGFDDYRYREYTQWLNTPFGDDLTTRLRGGLASPWFGFLHLWEIHYPRRVTPEYNSPEYGQHLYDRALSSLDRQLARLLDALPDNTVVVITGDHGEYLSDSTGGEVVSGLKRPAAWLKRRVPGIKKLKRHVMSTLFKAMDRFKQRDSEFYRAWVGHGFHVYEPLVHVPLIIYGPGLFPSGVEIAHLASHVDIFPTLVSAFDLPKANTSRVSGIDLTPIIQAGDKNPGGRSIYLEASGERTRARPEQWLTAVRTERYKYVRGLYNKTLPEELYDLEQDPAERNNLVGKLPEVAEMLRTRLDEMLEGAGEPQPDTATTYSPDEMAQLSQRLRDLGYVD